MGWSCSAAAARVLDAFTAYCVRSTGMTNVWKQGEVCYMIEVDRKEFRSGAITGEILRMESADPKGEGRAFHISNVKISGAGIVTQGPQVLKDAAKGWANFEGARRTPIAL